MQTVELKFNCFFLMPVLDAFPQRLREELEAAYDEDLDEVRGCRVGALRVLWVGGRLAVCGWASSGVWVLAVWVRSLRPCVWQGPGREV